MSGNALTRRIFGKMPQHGDFVGRGLSPSRRDALDRWLCAEMDAARQAHGDAFAARYAAAPAWHFVDVEGEGSAGTWWGGVLCASMDRAGRLFPLLMAAPAEAGPEAAAAISAGCLDLVAQAFAEGWDVDRLVTAPLTPAEVAWRPEHPGWALVGDRGPVVEWDKAQPQGVVRKMMDMVA